MRLPSLTRDTVDEAAPPRVVEPLEPVRVMLQDADLAGVVRPSIERMTDILRRGTPISFLPAGARPDEWQEIPAQDVLMVVPPPMPRKFWKREERIQRRVSMQVGPYTASGVAHLKPGQEQDLMLRATRPYLPLTDATFRRTDEPYEHRADTLIVNLAWVVDLHEA